MPMTSAAPRTDDQVQRLAPPTEMDFFPGLFWDHGDGTGIYRSRDGTTHQCNHHRRQKMARSEMIILTYRSSNE